MNFGKQWDKENCYRYAIHCTSAEGDGYGMNPGDFSNSNFIISTVAGIRDAIVADGAEFIAGSEDRDHTHAPAARQNHYAIAVCVGQANFHAVRRNEATGIWYGKLKGSNPAPWDEQNRPDIHNMEWSSPAAGPFGFPNWVGYFYVPTLGLHPPRLSRLCCVIL
jgi:hypothetical protein